MRLTQTKLPMTLAYLVMSGMALNACTQPNPGFVSAKDGSAGGDGATGDVDASAICNAANRAISCLDENTLLICDQAGHQAKIDCAPFGCDQTALRCEECDPGDPAVCDGDQRVSCENGRKVKTKCAGSCEQGICVECKKRTFFLDGDEDGYGTRNVTVEACADPSTSSESYVEDASDCDDTDDEAFPGQTNFFSRKTNLNGDFDFNCDGKEEKRYDELANCGSRPANACDGTGGWTYRVPDCGVRVQWVTCRRFGGNCGQASLSLVRQICR
ncbi:MAG: hypothetical protein H6707_11310 [Deltaproteobacteria bacterium]|nr:hypothetical protein [Deltaproteobacteria bacterium]